MGDPANVALPRIHRLSTLLANQIAAGEVVERPASVTKELLENSLDAGARQVTIDVEAGGARLIRVRDDGRGMHREDLSLALARHATSKISTLEDLEGIDSLGFRGEALPSIASVSRLTLSSRLADDETGWRLEASGREGDEKAVPLAVSHPPGTTVEVADLFYNTPARRKFLRAERTEFKHLEEVVRRFALGAFAVGVSLRHEGRSVFNLPPAGGETERPGRVARLCGKGFSDHALTVDARASGMRLAGWITGPSYTRTQADTQHFFVNGRPVRDALVRHGIRLAYEESLPPGQHAAYLLYLELDPDQVDVNVHPTKNEVRFRESRLVHDFLSSYVRRALGGEVLLPSMPPPFAGPGRGRAPIGRGPYPSHPSARSPGVADAGGRGGEEPGSPGAGAPLGQAVAGLSGAFVVAQAEDALLLIDVHAARRQIAGTRMVAALEGGGLRPQPVLVPAALALSDAEIRRLEERGPLLQRLGLSMRRIGPESVSLTEMPAPLRHADPTAMFRAVLARSGGGGDEDSGEGSIPAGLLDELTDLVARGTPLPSDLHTMNALLRELERWCEVPLASPVGIRLAEPDIRRLIQARR